MIWMDDAMYFVMWVKLFIERQVEHLLIYLINKKMGEEPSVLQQDNTSCICPKVKGKRSRMKQTRHIDIRYCYVTDQVKSGEVVLVYHPRKGNGQWF